MSTQRKDPGRDEGEMDLLNYTRRRILKYEILISELKDIHGDNVIQNAPLDVVRRYNFYVQILAELNVIMRKLVELA